MSKPSWLDHLSIWKHYIIRVLPPTLGYYTPYYLDQQCSSKDDFVKLTLPQSLISSNDAAILWGQTISTDCSLWNTYITMILQQLCLTECSTHPFQDISKRNFKHVKQSGVETHKTHNSGQGEEMHGTYLNINRISIICNDSNAY